MSTMQTTVARRDYPVLDKFVASTARAHTGKDTRRTMTRQSIGSGSSTVIPPIPALPRYENVVPSQLQHLPQLLCGLEEETSPPQYTETDKSPSKDQAGVMATRMPTMRLIPGRKLMYEIPVKIVSTSRPPSYSETFHHNDNRKTTRPRPQVPVVVVDSTIMDVLLVTACKSHCNKAGLPRLSCGFAFEDLVAKVEDLLNKHHKCEMKLRKNCRARCEIHLRCVSDGQCHVSDHILNTQNGKHRLEEVFGRISNASSTVWLEVHWWVKG